MTNNCVLNAYLLRKNQTSNKRSLSTEILLKISELLYLPQLDTLFSFPMQCMYEKIKRFVLHIKMLHFLVGICNGNTNWIFWNSIIDYFHFREMPKVGCNRFPNPSQKTKMRGCFLKSKFRLKGLMAATFLYTLNLYRNTEDSECIWNRSVQNVPYL